MAITAPQRPQTTKNAIVPTSPSCRSGSQRLEAITPAAKQTTAMIIGTIVSLVRPHLCRSCRPSGHTERQEGDGSQSVLTSMPGLHDRPAPTKTPGANAPSPSHPHPIPTPGTSSTASHPRRRPGKPRAASPGSPTAHLASPRGRPHTSSPTAVPPRPGKRPQPSSSRSPPATLSTPPLPRTRPALRHAR